MIPLLRWLLRWVKPDLHVAHISQVPLEQLWAKGIRVIFVDLDNTLLAWGATEVSDAVQQWLSQAKQIGFQVVIVSNAGRWERVNRVAQQLGITGFAGAWKPRRTVFRRYLAAVGLSPRQAAMIGDQLLTDILGAKRLGLWAILVEPLSPYRFLTGQWQRPLELLLLRWMRWIDETAS